MSELPGPSAEWLVPPDPLPLGADEVHVWRAGLQIPDGELDRLAAALSEDESRRAARFRFPELRRRFVAARGVLRDLLGQYLRLPPHVLRFEQNEHGKPFLSPGVAGDLRFNLSHSGDLALFAFARGREVGVDVEQVRALADSDRIAERFFTPAESARLRALPPEQHDRAFFECWVRKEAFVKAVGRGVSFGLDRFELPDVRRGPVAFTCPPDPVAWSLLPLDVGPDSVGAVVAAGTDWRPLLWQWQAGPAGQRP